MEVKYWRLGVASGKRWGQLQEEQIEVEVWGEVLQGQDWMLMAAVECEELWLVCCELKEVFGWIDVVEC